MRQVKPVKAIVVLVPGQLTMTTQVEYLPRVNSAPKVNPVVNDLVLQVG
jgi:hypothetical protein